MTCPSRCSTASPRRSRPTLGAISLLDVARPAQCRRMSEHLPPPQPWRLSVAPMMDWTDRHCRFFHRLITRRTRLYTEMVTTGALRHGDVPRHLDFDPAELPVALQLGGSEPDELAHGARLAQTGATSRSI